MNKTNKKIAVQLYLIGMSKNNIFRTMKQNGFNVRRKEIRNYLDVKIYGRESQFTRYRKRYANTLKELHVGMIKDVQHARDRLNKNYLTYVSISLLKNKKIKYTRTLSLFVHKQTIGKYVIQWTS
jgi:hypothetical protein